MGVGSTTLVGRPGLELGAVNRRLSIPDFWPLNFATDFRYLTVGNYKFSKKKLECSLAYFILLKKNDLYSQLTTGRRAFAVCQRLN